ncbi:hypothetical protein JQ594_00575 [Bradyrhizobium manausense]|uniref:hypothetical protein n=1 Tax=Bradyrhizobium manausense TaxID=989370 RepID=UPI001BA46D08|nr:hypothetical protein [Bradyrhizobium manausense]MBR0684398.1 hypothetical protein [Bradyrhizobium manausense]
MVNHGPAVGIDLGSVQPIVLSDGSRISRSHFVCTDCGMMFDVDVTAAKNILSIGISPTGGLPGIACGSSRTAGRKQEGDAREGESSALQRRE